MEKQGCTSYTGEEFATKRSVEVEGERNKLPYSICFMALEPVSTSCYNIIRRRKLLLLTLSVRKKEEGR